VKYDECEDLPRERCRNITLKEPFQERIHREKCLLPSPDLQPDINALDNDSSFPLGLAVLKRVNNKETRNGKRLLLNPRNLFTSNFDDLESILNETYEESTKSGRFVQEISTARSDKLLSGEMGQSLLGSGIKPNEENKEIQKDRKQRTQNKQDRTKIQINEKAIFSEKGSSSDSSHIPGNGQNVKQHKLSNNDQNKDKPLNKKSKRKGTIPDKIEATFNVNKTNVIDKKTTEDPNKQLKLRGFTIRNKNS